MKNIERGVTLIELLVSLSISLVVLGGTIAAFNTINSGVRNAARSTDLTNGVRGIFSMMQKDLYSATRGTADLNALQIHFNSDLAPGEDYFYGISKLSDAGGASEIVLQWFDYSVAGGRNPTFVVLPQNGNTTVGNQFPSLVFCSYTDSDPELDAIQPGDVFVLYPGKAMDYHWNDLRRFTSEGTGGLIEESTNDVGAGIVEVESITDTTLPGNHGSDPKPFRSVKLVSFKSSGTFNNNFGEPIGTILRDPEMLSKYTAANAPGEPAKYGIVRYPPETWFARKLGRATDYNRVRYSLNGDTLIRDQNGNELILSTKVSNFNIWLGIGTRDITSDDWDGAVSLVDKDDWFLDSSDLGGGTLGDVMIGKHSYAAWIEITKTSIFDDFSDQNTDGSGGTKKTRYFSQMIKLKNSHLPLANAYGNDENN